MGFSYDRDKLNLEHVLFMLCEEFDNPKLIIDIEHVGENLEYYVYLDFKLTFEKS